MAEILYVEDNIRVEALRQELARMGSGAVAVVLPKHCDRLDSLPRLRLLQRQAQVLGQELALVTWNQSIRRNANRLGIPVYGSDASLRGRSWSMGRAQQVASHNPSGGLPEPPPWRNRDGSPNVKVAAHRGLSRIRQRRILAERSYRRVTPWWLQVVGYVLVGMFLAVFVGGFVYFVLPAATVSLVPGQRALEATVLLTADPQLEEADFERGLLPARLVETSVEDTGSVLTTGSGWSDVELARGKVVFTNQTNRTVRIPAGTIVSASTSDRRIDFRILEELEIAGPIGTEAEVEIEATEPGSLGNQVASNRITTVAGALRTQVRVTNPEPPRGGVTVPVRLVTQADKDRLLGLVYDGIKQRAYEALSPELRGDEWMPQGLVQPYIVAQAFDQFNDEEANELSLTLRVLIHGVAISRSASEEAAMAALRKAVPERGQLVADSIRFSIEPHSVVSGRTLRYSVKASGNYVIPIDTRAVGRTVTGLSVEEAGDRLQEEWLLAGEPKFYQDPGWFATLPQFASRIQVRVELSEAVLSGQ